MRPVSFASSLAACTAGTLSATFLIAGTGAASAASLFENYLERGYSEVAVYAQTKARNAEASLHFSQKAADAANGRMVTPDSPADTGRPVAYLAEQYDAHTRLLEALAAGAAEDNARMAAVAQINYDCWLAELSAGPGQPDSSACRLLFYTALDQLLLDPELDNFVTLAGAANTDDASDQSIGGHAGPDRVLPRPSIARADGVPVTSTQQADAGPISALSPLASDDYATAALIYPAPVTTLPATSPAPGGAASEHATGVGAPEDGASDSVGGAVGGAGGAVGDTVGGASAAVGGAVSGVGDAVGGPVGGVANTAGGAVSGLGGAAGGAVSGVAGAAGGAVSGVGGALGGALGGLGDRLN